MARIDAWRGGLAAATLLGFATAASAQTPVQPQPKDPNMPGQHNTLPEKIDRKPADATGSTNTLSDRLERTDGVIRPNDTGAGRTITPPDTGTMPVVPPAGTPGSTRPNADPK